MGVTSIRALGRAMRHGLARVLGAPPVMLGRPWVFDLARLVGVLVVAALSIWIAVASALLWGFSRYPDAHGVFAMVASGASAWIVAVPVPPALKALCLLWPYPGKFAPVLVCATTTFALTLAAGAVLQGAGSQSFNDAAGLSVPAILVVEVCALALALSDVVPPDRPLAAPARYFSVRQWQFYDLYQWGRTHGWQVRTVSGRAVGVELRGAPDPLVPALQVAVCCLCGHASRPPRLSIHMAWPQELPWFHLGTTPPRVPLPPGVVVARWRRRLGRPLWCYVGPDAAGHPLSEQQMDELHTLAQRAGLALWGHGAIRRTRVGLVYRWRPWPVIPQYPNMETLTWLKELALLLAKHDGAPTASVDP